MKKQAALNFDIILAAALGLFSLGAFYLSLNMFSADTTYASSGALPLGISSMMVFISFALLWKLTRRRLQIDMKQVDKKVPITILFLICYAASIEFAGFYLSTFAFAAITSSWMGKSDLKGSLYFSAALTILLWIVFGTVFKVALP